MEYDRVHRFLLRSISSRGVMSLAETEQILNKFTDNEQSNIQNLVKEINEVIRPYQQCIKITSDELTSEEVIVFLSLGYDDTTKSQNIFSANELEYFRVLLENIMTTETRQITGIHAMNLVSQVKSSFKKTDAEKLLNTWCRMRYLDKDENNYALGVRAIHEFEGYFRQNMPNVVEECFLCKQIVFRGVNCPSCAKAVHTRCLKRYLEKVEKWPCCKSQFNAKQLEELNNYDSNRFTELVSQTQRLEMTQPFEDNNATESTQQEPIEEMEIIPEISQRITRKRRRESK